MVYHLPHTVHYDEDYEIWVVRQASHAFSFSTFPVIREKNGEVHPIQYEFDTNTQAKEQARRLDKWIRNGGHIEYRRRETPALFEAVADTKYGCAW